MKSAKKPVVITVASDGGEISYTSNSERAETENGFAGGVFEGNQQMIDEVRFLLNKEYGPDSVMVSYYQSYEFTEGRDTLDDIAAAMAGAFPRRVMNAKGNKILASALEAQEGDSDGEDIAPVEEVYGPLPEIIY